MDHLKNTFFYSVLLKVLLKCGFYIERHAYELLYGGMFFHDSRIKTWPRIDLIPNGFWRAWRRLKTEIASFQTTLKSSKSEQYKVDSWPCFDFGAFFYDFWCIFCDFWRFWNLPKICENHKLAMNRHDIARILLILASFESWRSQLLNGAKLVKIH